MSYLKIGLAALVLTGVGFGYFSINGKSAAEKWHAEGELDPKADFSIAKNAPLPSTRYVADTAHSSVFFKASH